MNGLGRERLLARGTFECVCRVGTALAPLRRVNILSLPSYINITWTVFVFVCVLSSRCLACRPSHLCVCRVEYIMQ